MFDDEDFNIDEVDFSFTNEPKSTNKNNQSFNSDSDSPQNKISKTSLSHSAQIRSLFEENQIQDFTICKNNDKLRNFDTSKNTSVSKRKFPGPAGILPQRPSLQLPIHSKFDSNESLEANRHEIEQASSQFISIFDTTAWKCAMEDLDKINIKNIQDCNISHLKRAVFSSKSKALKYPFLVAAISNMDLGQELFVTLKDSTGDMQAYINSEVLEQFPSDLKKGSVLLLKNVGVLKSGQARGMYLLITLNNMALIYPSDLKRSQLSSLIKICQNIDCDFTNLDVSLNSSLDTSIHSPMSYRHSVQIHNKQSPTGSTLSNINHKSFRTNNYENRNQTLQGSKICLPSKKSSLENSLKKPSLPLQSSFNHVPNNPKLNNYQICDKKQNAMCNSSATTKLSINVLSQNGVSPDDLSSTVNSLFDGIDADSMFGDF